MPSTWRSEAAWRQALCSLAIGSPDAVYKSIYDPTVRIYLDRHAAHKIKLKTGLPDLYPRLAPGACEADILGRCAGIAGLPSLHGFRETPSVQMLSMSRLEGRTLQDAIGEVSTGQAVRIIVRLLQTTLAVSWRGIAHNDIGPRNVILDRSAKPHLIDFNQAHHAGRVSALFRNILGTTRVAPPVYGSWLLIAGRLVYKFVFPRKAANMPRLPSGASPLQHRLVNAWAFARRVAAKVGGDYVVNYSLAAEGLDLPGKWPWHRRWTMLRKAADFTGLRTLELGCNMGLLSTWLLKEGQAASAVGVDRNPLILQSAKRVADAFAIDTSFEMIDLDAAYPWETRFEPRDFDVVFALDVFDGPCDKPRLMRFLGAFPLVVFEGREPDPVVIERFAAAGLSHHRILGTSDSGRTVFVFSR